MSEVTDSLLLPRDERRKSQRLCIIHNFWNGIGAGFVVGDIIALLALYYGASNSQMALIFAALFLSFPASLLAPKLLAGFDCTHIWRGMWLGRAFLIPLYLLVPFLPEDYRVWAVIFLYYLFCAFRAIGVSALYPVFQILSSSSERSVFMGRHIRAFTMASIIVALVAYLFLEIGVFEEEISNYNALVVLGFIFCLVSASYLFFLPRTGVLSPMSLHDLGRACKRIIYKQNMFRVALLFVLQTMVFVLAGYTITFFKRVMGLSSERILFLSLIGLIGATTATLLLQIVSKRISAWGLMLVAHAIIGAGTFFFAFTDSLSVPDYYLAFIPAVVMIYFGRQGAIAIMMKTQTDVLPSDNRYTFSSAFQLSRVIASLLAIGLIFISEKWLQYLPLPGWGRYSPVFAFCSLLSLAICILSISWHGIFRTAADLKLMAPRSLMAFMRAHMLSMDNNKFTRSLALEALMYRDNALSRTLVMEYINSVDIQKKTIAIRSLIVNQIQECADKLLVEGENPYFNERGLALTALGFHECEEHFIPRLVKLLDDPSGLVRASAIKTLFRFGYEISCQEFMGHYSGFTNAKQRITAYFGASLMNRIDVMEAVFRHDEKYGDKWLVVLYQITAEHYDRRDEMIELAEAALRSHEDGRKVLQDITEGEPVDTIPQWLPQSTRMSSLCSEYLWQLISNERKAG